MHNRIVLDPYAHYPLMQFPQDFPLNNIYSDLWNNHTGPGTHYHDCSQAGGYRTHIDFEQITWVDYKLFPITPITPAQLADLERVLHNSQPSLTLHLSLEDQNTDHADYYLAPYSRVIRNSPKPIALEVLTRGELRDWRQAKNCATIRMLFESIPQVQSLTYIHSVGDGEQYQVDLNSYEPTAISRIDKW